MQFLLMFEQHLPKTTVPSCKWEMSVKMLHLFRNVTVCLYACMYLNVITRVKNYFGIRKPPTNTRLFI